MTFRSDLREEPPWGANMRGQRLGGPRSFAPSLPAARGEGLGYRRRHGAKHVEFVVRVHTIETSTIVEYDLEKTFAFFSDASNLERLTPPWLSFKIVTPLPIAMQEGALIDYRISLHGLPIRWRTRIEVWEPPHRFVDLQLKGPYRLWHHEHRFEAVEGGTRVTDRVRYSHLGGSLVHRLLVEPDVKRIFAYRAEALRNCRF